MRGAFFTSSPFIPSLHFMLKVPPEAGQKGLGGQVYNKIEILTKHGLVTY